MKEEIQFYLSQYNERIQQLFVELRELIFQSIPCEGETEIEEKLWAKLPSYYMGDRFVRLIAFKDHINIEAKKILEYKECLEKFKITPKGMLQIDSNQSIPKGPLHKIFKETLLG